jgi:dTDP-4-dehydrorhamnose reductase
MSLGLPKVLVEVSEVGKKVLLLLGHTGKMGVALKDVFESDYYLIGKNSSNFDAGNFEQVQNTIEVNNPDIVINAVAFSGIDHCEKDPEKALRLNTLYPKLLAELSNEKGFLLVHFSTDAVFNDDKGDFYIEKDYPQPFNIYGLTKYGGDLFIQAIAKCYYIFRLSILFGDTTKNTQFVEKMLQKVREGHKVLECSDDIICSPTYSKDVAKGVRRILENSLLFGLYHVANQGKASLYDLMKEIIGNLDLDVRVERTSYKDFPSCGKKNTYTPIKSQKIDSLRPWKEAVKDYCARLMFDRTAIRKLDMVSF